MLDSTVYTRTYSNTTSALLMRNIFYLIMNMAFVKNIYLNGTH